MLSITVGGRVAKSCIFLVEKFQIINLDHTNDIRMRCFIEYLVSSSLEESFLSLPNFLKNKKIIFLKKQQRKNMSFQSRFRSKFRDDFLATPYDVTTQKFVCIQLKGKRRVWLDGFLI